MTQIFKIKNYLVLGVLVLFILIVPFFAFAQEDSYLLEGDVLYTPPPDPLVPTDRFNNIIYTTPIAYRDSPSAQPNDCLFCSLQDSPKFQDLLSYTTCIISASVIPLIFALAVAMFVWGVVQYVINSDEEAKKAKGRQFMIWGIIALAVMISVWGLVRILGTTFGIEYAIPQVKGR